MADSMTARERRKHALFGYVRQCSMKYLIQIPIDVIQVMILFYGLAFKIYASGYNKNGEWGIGNKLRSRQKYVELTDLYTLTKDPKDITYSMRMFVKSEGNVYAAGDNAEHRLGIASENKMITKFTSLTFPDLNNGDYIDIISNGHQPLHTLFITKKSKTVYGIGKCQFGQLGPDHDENKVIRLTAIPYLSTLFSNDNVIKIECGKYHSLMLTKSGKMYSCGSNDSMQCGRETPDNILTPYQIANDIHDISAGDSHNLSISFKGELFVFGGNFYQQLGNGSHKSSPIMKIPYFKENNVLMQKIAAGGWHNIVMDTDGICWGFGWSEYGQLAIKEDYVATPIKLSISTKESIEYITCGPWHSVLLTKQNEIYTFGYNSCNECSIYNNTPITSAHHVKREELGIHKDCKISAVIAGYQSTLFVIEE